MTHMRKCADTSGEHRRGRFAASPVFLCFFYLHDLHHKITYRLCCLILFDFLRGGALHGYEQNQTDI